LRNIEVVLAIIIVRSHLFFVRLLLVVIKADSQMAREKCEKVTDINVVRMRFLADDTQLV
jgi:hypothetical protein